MIDSYQHKGRRYLDSGGHTSHTMQIGVHANDGTRTHLHNICICHIHLFQGASIIIYMGAVLSILYYYGLTQKCAAKTAWLMQISLGTTAIETLGVASNIFLNGVSTRSVLCASCRYL